MRLAQSTPLVGRPAAGAGPRRRSAGLPLQSVDRALSLLEALAGAGSDGCTLASLSRDLGLHPSTTHHILTSLLNRGFVEQAPISGAYRLGPAVLTLSREFLQGSDLAALAEPHVRALHAELDEWVFLAVLRGGRSHFIVEFQSTHPFVVNRQAPRANTLHCTSSGKVLLSGVPPAHARALLEAQGLPRFTRHTITGLDAVLWEIAGVAERGYAENRQENWEGLCGVSAPIYDASGTLVAALGVAYPVFRGGAAREAIIRQAVQRVAAALSARLGYTEDAAPSRSPAGANSVAGGSKRAAAHPRQHVSPGARSAAAATDENDTKQSE